MRTDPDNASTCPMVRRGFSRGSRIGICVPVPCNGHRSESYEGLPEKYIRERPVIHDKSHWLLSRVPSEPSDGMGTGVNTEPLSARRPSCLRAGLRFTIATATSVSEGVGGSNLYSLAKCRPVPSFPLGSAKFQNLFFSASARSLSKSAERRAIARSAPGISELSRRERAAKFRKGGSVSIFNEVVR